MTFMEQFSPGNSAAITAAKATRAGTKSLVGV